jgi:hypothetical protein
MRTLLDLFDDELGYVRVYEEQEGFGYELSTYVQQPMSDLFARMNGYASIAAAREAARYQLAAAAKKVRRMSRKPPQRRVRRRSAKLLASDDRSLADQSSLASR